MSTHGCGEMSGGLRIPLGSAHGLQLRLRWQCPCGRLVSSSGELHHHHSTPNLYRLGVFVCGFPRRAGSPPALQRYASKQPSEFHLAFGVRCLDVWGNFSPPTFLTGSLDSTSLHRGYVCCGSTLADAPLAMTSARAAASCSPRVNWLVRWLVRLAGQLSRADAICALLTYLRYPLKRM